MLMATGESAARSFIQTVQQRRVLCRQSRAYCGSECQRIAGCGEDSPGCSLGPVSGSDVLRPRRQFREKS